MTSPTHRLLVALVLAGALPVHGDEGMWPLNQLPVDQLRSRYQFQPPAGWAEHLQRSCIRFGRGSSAAFVSPDGLIMTNHHVGAGAIYRLSTTDHDYLADGFYAPTRAQELKCAGLELFVLRDIRDVTAEVNASIERDTAPDKADKIRDANSSRIEQEAKRESDLHPEIVKLYGGRLYHLYRYHKYDDVRLVWAPEKDIAAFGGDVRNFEYPRHCLDLAFFRAYENNRPARVQNHLTWNQQGARSDELVFVIGHPYRTRRLYTIEHLRLLRDVELPLILRAYNQLEVTLIEYTSRGAEEARIGSDLLGSIQNGRKAFGGIHAGLVDPSLFERKRQAEQALRDFVARSPDLQAQLGDPWQDIAAGVRRVEPMYATYYLLENRRMSLGRLYGIARSLVRYAQETPKPDAERWPEYRDVQLPSVRSALIETGPLYADLERTVLTDGLLRMARVLGGDDEIVRTTLAGHDAATLADQLLAGSRLIDQDYRQQLLDSGPDAILASDDALIRFARQLDPITRRLRTQVEEQFDAVANQAYPRIAEAQYAMLGAAVYPDATGTLRVSLGTIKRYEEAGQVIAPFTTTAQLYADAARHDQAQPFRLPAGWREHEADIDLQTPVNYVSTVDIIGGNSGSPTVNRAGEVVGIIFDGNRQSLIWDIQFDDRQARGVHVDARFIIEALRSVYGATPLVDELLGQ